MNKGDTLQIILDYMIDGTPIEEMDLDEIEFTIGAKSFKLTDDDITVDEGTGKYVLQLDQEDTFSLGGTADYQVRFRKGEKVTSTDIAEIKFGRSLSTEVI